MSNICTFYENTVSFTAKLYLYKFSLVDWRLCACVQGYSVDILKPLKPKVDLKSLSEIIYRNTLNPPHDFVEY